MAVVVLPSAGDGSTCVYPKVWALVKAVGLTAQTSATHL
jgi:hypothetical protein